MEHDATHELLARGFRERGQATQVVPPNRGGRLDLDSDETAIAELQDDVDLCSQVRTEMEERRPFDAPAGQLAQLGRDEAFEKRAERTGSNSIRSGSIC